ncbi:tetratricopeptide repeat protein [Ferruginibacter albus]|uniref:tetratricopeptide repeat protein n=1 Tax=Ferruginibacter albus TaxID=2875540 RepID=UPI001CC72CFB|nr:tetratricopeptide repeat protein [Ferruginibacter albus]UAY52588.1 tetratricopeptide repeat protein [Ferruginibacter albus]
MSKYPYRQDREEMRELLNQYQNLKNGKAHSFIEEDSFEKIIDYFDEKDQLKDAIEAADYAIEQYPYSSSLLIKKADLLIANKQYKESLYYLGKAEVLDVSDINLYILKTDAYLALDQQEKAAVVLEAALDYFSGDERLELLFELADVYDDYENFEKVFDCLKMILEQDPNNEEALYKICFWTDFTGRNEEGIRLHQKIIDDYPFSELAWFNLAAAYQGIKLYEKAIDAYQYAVAIDEKFDYAWRNMGDAYLRLRKYKEAIEALQKVLELSRPEDVIYEAIGHCYDKMQNYAQARFHYRKAVHLNQEDSQLHYKIACTYMNESEWERAIKSLEAAMRIHPSQSEYNLAMGQCYSESGKVEEAIQYFAQALKIKPKNVNYWLELLRFLYKSDCFEEGVEYTDYAIKQTADKPIFLFYKSAFLFALGKSKEALLQLEEGMAKAPKLIKKLIELNPAILQSQPVVDIIARFKRNKSI